MKTKIKINVKAEQITFTDKIYFNIIGSQDKQIIKTFENITWHDYQAEEMINKHKYHFVYENN